MKTSERSRRQAGSAPSGDGDGVVRRGPRDLPEVAFGVREIGVAAFEELGICRFFRKGAACLADLRGECIDFAWFIDRDDDAESDATVADLGRGAAVGRQLVDREEGKDRAAKLEDRVVVAVEHEWPAETTVEVALRVEVAD